MHSCINAATGVLGLSFDVRQCVGIEIRLSYNPSRASVTWNSNLLKNNNK